MKLKHPFFENEDEKYFGISQTWSLDNRIRKWGCGASAAVMVIAYLGFYHDHDIDVDLSKNLQTKNELADILDSIGASSIPIIPHIGINGIILSLSLNTFFIKNRMPYRASWVSGWDRIIKCTGEMLKNDIPVILSVGPDFPLFFKKHPIGLYQPSDMKKPARTVSGHYMVAVEMSDKFIRVSSWGKEYYISIEEWRKHHKLFSGGITDGIVAIRKQK